ncbi:MAG TPA: c-type cytochrome [Solirubrobacterales bacterium]
MGRRRSSSGVLGSSLLALGVVAVLGLGILIGVLIAGDNSSAPGTLEADEIGNVKDGRTLFVTQGCAMCHSFEGQGGTDAPPLDFMKGELTGGEVANMSGLIWNHVPVMEEAFKEEKIPFPEFKANQMASLIAYLHAGGPPPEVKNMGSAMGGGGNMGAGEAGGGKSGGKEQMGSSSMGGGAMGGE